MADDIVFWLEDHAIPVFAVLGVALLLVGYMAFTGQRREPVTLDETQMREFDTQATTGLRAAAAALDSYATTHGDYSGATTEEIEATVPAGTDLPQLALDARESTYAVSVTSESGATFSIERAADRSVAYPCGPPGIGLCSSAATWAY